MPATSRSQCQVMAVVAVAFAALSYPGGVTAEGGNPYGQIGVPLEEHMPSEIRSVDGELRAELTLDAFYYDGFPARFWTRAFNGEWPAPTLRVRRGDAVHLHFENALKANRDPGEHNTFRLPNTTNLHTHGLHVSGEGSADNIRVTIEPEGSFDYHYVIEPDHAPGTHWYHPHFHGATAVQVGGGTAGALIVEEEESDLPPEILGYMEKVIVMQHIYARTSDPWGLYQVSEASMDDLFFPSYEPTGNADPDLRGSWWLMNGLYQPTISIQPGEWQRWRFVTSAVDKGLIVTIVEKAPTRRNLRNGPRPPPLPVSAPCGILLLSKDGVTVSPAPRAVEVMYFNAATRADILIRCDEPGEYDMISTPRTGRDVSDCILGTIVVGGETVSMDAPREFIPARPDYLADLTTITNSGTVRGDLRLTQGGAGPQINGRVYQEGDIMDQFTMGTVIQRSVTDFAGEHQNGAEHPFHLHVTPFQLRRFPRGNGAEQGTHGWTRVGDWHDTLLILEPGLGNQNEYDFRFQAAQFGGHYAFHCHVLAHEDLGMMGVYDTAGEEGTPPSIRSEQRECVIVDSGMPCAGFGQRNVTATNEAIAARLAARCKADPSIKRWQRGGALGANATGAAGAR